MLGCAGAGHAKKFAEICGSVALAGELAIVGAMAGGQFATAHESGSRKAFAATQAVAVNGSGIPSGRAP
jgi:hydroxymethylglutaryl-CoA reductase